MNLTPLKYKDFTIVTGEMNYAYRFIPRDDLDLQFTVMSDGAIHLTEYPLMEESEEPTDIFIGEVNSIEQALVLFDMINAINTSGTHGI